VEEEDTGKKKINAMGGFVVNEPMVEPIPEGPTPSWPQDIDLARRVMEDMLIPLFHDQPACRKIGFRNISRLIGYIPGWYLWTEERRGAFLLELMRLRSLNDRFVAAYFLIRYYPSPDEADFSDFAPREQKVRLGPFFDQTGTPKFESQEHIHESLFAIGNLNLEINRGLNLIKLKLFSQNRWREVRDDLREGEGTGMLEIHRNVPGWELSWALFDKLLLGFCYVHRASPLGLRLTLSPGVTYHLGTDERVFEVPESTIQRWALETGLLLKSAPTSDPVLETWKKKFYLSLWRPPQRGQKWIAGLTDAPEEEALWIDSKWRAASSWTFPREGNINHRCFQDH
jgi:hypothetical protein